MADTQKKLLLLVDLNGTLGYRCEVALKGRKPDLYLRHKNYYFRSDAVSFLKKMSNHYDVCIYTSIMKQNAEAAVNALDKDHKEYISKIYDQSYNKQDPQGAKMWDTIRDMEKVYGRSGFSKTNTILLDNEPRKFRETPRNGIVVPEYGRNEAKSNISNTLTRLGKYLILLAESNVTDVRQYMEETPYHNYPGLSLVDVVESQAEFLPLNLEKSLHLNEITKAMINDRVLGEGMIVDRVCNGGEVWYHEQSLPSRYRVHIRALNQKTYHREMQLARVLENSEGKALIYYHSDTNDLDTPGVLLEYSMAQVNDFLK
jgi:hypothetical protein